MENQKLLIFRQIKRELICANTLADRLQEYYSRSSNVASFIEKAEAEAKELTSNSFGSSLLRVVGILYMDVALEHINMTGRISSAIKRQYNSIANNASVIYSSLKLLSQCKKMFFVQKDLERIEEESDKLKANNGKTAPNDDCRNHDVKEGESKIDESHVTSSDEKQQHPQPPQHTDNKRYS